MAEAAHSTVQDARLHDDFYDEVAREHLMPLWTTPDVLTTEPKTAVVPYRWRWETVRAWMMRAGEVVDTDSEAERRVLMFANPGLGGRPATTQSLLAAMQLVLPGETARSHRHTPAALRFVVEGAGGFTVVDGEKTYMERGDFVTTPNWAWHDHGNDGDGPMLWFDGLDQPVVASLNAIFFELLDQRTQPVTRPLDDSIRRYAMGVRPTYSSHAGRYSPIVNYRYSRTREVLSSLAEADDGSPYDGIVVEYLDPLRGASALPTLGAYAQLLVPGKVTATHRHSSSTVYLVREGHGYSVVGDQRIEWAENDVFVVPTWAWHHHANGSSSQDAVLLSFDEAPLLRALDLFREQSEEAAA